MRYTAIFDIPDDEDAKWRVLWSISEACAAFYKVKYPVQIAVFDESGAQTLNWTHNT